MHLRKFAIYSNLHTFKELAEYRLPTKDEINANWILLFDSLIKWNSFLSGTLPTSNNLSLFGLSFQKVSDS